VGKSSSGAGNGELRETGDEEHRLRELNRLK